ncbi:MAG: rRNA pseudouridine synthase [Candidatus Rokubacteria bacterium]|nr:rRNA pseudouridine synthase [Candidatus Rokubacteria bacterium]
MEQRLQKILAEAGIASRRGSERLIRGGQVRVNGEVITRLGSLADPDHDQIEVSGRLRPRRRPKRYILLSKPAGYMTSRVDFRGRPLVFDLVPPELRHLASVGRLDFLTEGLLLLTNDGEVAYHLTHPRYEVPRVYEVEVKGEISSATLTRLRQGVVLDDGPARPKTVLRLRRAGNWLHLTLTEGRYREVRRLCRAVGLPVLRLRRVQYGPLRLQGLREGQWRSLTPREVKLLKSHCGLSEFRL